MSSLNKSCLQNILPAGWHILKFALVAQRQTPSLTSISHKRETPQWDLVRWLFSCLHLSPPSPYILQGRQVWSGYSSSPQFSCFCIRSLQASQQGCKGHPPPSPPPTHTLTNTPPTPKVSKVRRVPRESPSCQTSATAGHLVCNRLHESSCFQIPSSP